MRIGGAIIFQLIVMIVAAVCMLGCSTNINKASKPRFDFLEKSSNFDSEISGILKRYDVYSLAAGVLKDGDLVWAGYYGEQSPGMKLTTKSMFNTASISKVITTETVLKLIDKKIIGFDDSMAEFWVDPDIKDDPRHKLLTPRIVLTHRTGFLNWRYMEEDEILRFHNNPDEVFGYSGEGMQYLKRYVENKTKRNFEDWVQELIFEPLEMEHSTIVDKKELKTQLVIPYSEGKPYKPNIHPKGKANAADDFFTTIEDYAKLLQSIIGSSTSEKSLHREKIVIQSSIAEHKDFSCIEKNDYICPTAYGFGIGWLVFDYPEYKLVWHGGNDATEHAIGFINPETGNGVIVFANGAKSLFAILDVLDLIDEHSKIADYYRLLLGI